MQTDITTDLVAVHANTDYHLSVFGGAGSFELGQRMANALAHSTLVPEDYRKQVWNKDTSEWRENPCAIGNCIIALEYASRLRISPLMVMQNLDVVNGRPSWRGMFLIALINASPLFGRVKFEFAGTLEDKNWKCRAMVPDAATGEILPGTWITWKMVNDEGWLDKKQSKWKTMPEQMFQYRAAAFWARVHAPDLLLGLQTSEERHDDVPVTVTGRRKSAASLNERLALEPSNTEAIEGELVEKPEPQTVGAASVDTSTEFGDADLSVEEQRQEDTKAADEFNLE